MNYLFSKEEFLPEFANDENLVNRWNWEPSEKDREALRLAYP